jgi:hypothetical protein
MNMVEQMFYSSSEPCDPRIGAVRRRLRLNLPQMTGEMTDEDRDFSLVRTRNRSADRRQATYEARNPLAQVIGGWAIKPYRRPWSTRTSTSFFRDDLSALIDHLAPRYCVWSNLSAFGRCAKRRTCSRAPGSCRCGEMAAAHG